MLRYGGPVSGFKSSISVDIVYTTKIYDKRDNCGFDIVNFPVLMAAFLVLHISQLNSLGRVPSYFSD